MATLTTYNTYKPSGIDWIGDIPSHWEVKKLKYIANIQPSNVDKKSFENEETVLLCNYMDVYRNEYVNDTIDFMQATATYDEIKKFTIQKGDVLVTKDSETPDDIANAACIQTDLVNVLCGYHLTHIRPQSDILIGEYLFRLFYADRYKRQFQVAANGVTRFGLSVAAFTEAYAPLPPLPEQTAIAHYLDEKTAQLDTLINRKRRLITLLREEKTALINEAVTKGIQPNVAMKDSGIDWLGDIPSHWEALPLTKYLGPIIDYRGRTPQKQDEGVFLVTARNIKKGQIDYSLSEEYVSEDEWRKFMQRGELAIGDVLFTTEAPLGEVANVDRTDVCLAQRVIKFRGLEGFVNNYFLKYWMSSNTFQNDLQSYATGSTALGIKSSKLSQLTVILPPPSEQSNIVAHLDTGVIKIDHTISRIEREIVLMQEYRTALISEVVTGKVCVI